MQITGRRSVTLLGLGPAILLAVLCCSAQNPADTTPSLGDLARQLRAERARQAPTVSRVYTNDSFPSLVSPESGARESTSESAERQPERSKGATTIVEDQSTRSDNQDYYRGTMRRLRNKLAADQKTLQETLKTIHDRWDPLGLYTGLEPPNDKFSRYVPRYWDEILQYQKLKAARAAVAADEKAISDLEDQCRRAGCSPAWLR